MWWQREKGAINQIIFLGFSCMQYNPVLESQKVNDSQGHDGEDDDYYDGDHNDDGNY